MAGTDGGIMIPHVEKFQPKSISEVKRRFVPSTGTFEFIFDMGEKARKIVAILNTPENGFVLGEMTTHHAMVGQTEFTVEKQDVFKKGDEQGKRVGVLEVQKDGSGNIHSAFLGATNRNAVEIARLVHSS